MPIHASYQGPTLVTPAEEAVIAAAVSEAAVTLGSISGHSHGQRKSCGRNGTPGHLLLTSEDTAAVDAYTTTAIPQHTTPAMGPQEPPPAYCT